MQRNGILEAHSLYNWPAGTGLWFYWILFHGILLEISRSLTETWKPLFPKRLWISGIWNNGIWHVLKFLQGDCAFSLILAGLSWKQNSVKNRSEIFTSYWVREPSTPLRKKIWTSEAFARSHHWPLKVRAREQSTPWGKPSEQSRAGAGFVAVLKGRGLPVWHSG